METWILRGVICSVAIGLSGSCLAGAGIYQRDAADGAVELSNVAEEEEGQVLLLAPSSANETAATAPAGRQAATAPLREAQTERLREEGGGDTAADPAGGRRERAALAAAMPSGQQSLATEGAQPSNYGLSPGGVAYTPGVATPGTVGVPVAATPGGGGLPVEASVPPTQTGSGLPAGGAGVPSTPPAASSILDSPSALAARLAQYRDLMLSEPLQPNGLPQNPAAVRRYLMVDRAGFASRGK